MSSVENDGHFVSASMCLIYCVPRAPIFYCEVDIMAFPSRQVREAGALFSWRDVIRQH